MANLKAPKEIVAAKAALEDEIRETLHIITTQFHDKYPGWLITDLDIGIIDVSLDGEQKRMTAASRAELTSNDLEMKICKAGQVKAVKE